MKQPTKEQVKEFWEWCGFTLKEVKFGMNGIVPQWILKDYADWDVPPIDLNNLFKYAVPKLDQSRYYKALNSIFYYDATKESPALALFWAIWEVMRSKT